jgi:hypothetical protein
MTINHYNTKYSNKSIINSSKNLDPIYYNQWKDQRLEFVEIPKGLIEVLQNAGFTIEKIQDSCPSEIAEKLGIDYHIGEIIFKETKKAISKINPDLLLINK